MKKTTKRTNYNVNLGVYATTTNKNWVKNQAKKRKVSNTQIVNELINNARKPARS